MKIDQRVPPTRALNLKIVLHLPSQGSVVPHLMIVVHGRDVTRLVEMVGWPPAKMGLTTVMVQEERAEAPVALQGTVMMIGTMLVPKPMVAAAVLAPGMTGAPLMMRMIPAVPQGAASHLECAFAYE